jgi:hypothetical protein
MSCRPCHHFMMIFPEREIAVLSADSIKLDAILAAVRSNGRAIHDLDMSTQAIVDGLQHVTTILGTQRELIAQLLEAATTEPDESIADLLHAILENFGELRGVIGELKDLPAKVSEAIQCSHSEA